MIGFLIALYACQPVEEKPETISSTTADTLAQQKTSVDISSVSVGEFYRYIRVQGKVQFERQVPLHFTTSGVIASVRVKNSDKVKSGQTLASLEDAALLLDLKETQVRYQSSLLEYQNQVAGVGDSSRHGDNWPIIKQNLELISGMRSAKIALEKTQLRLEQMILYAPSDGVLVDWEAQVGQPVASSRPLGVLLDPASQVIETKVLEYELAGLQVGDSASIRSASDPSLMLVAWVQEINPKVASDGFVKVKLAFDSEQRLLQGQSVSVKLKVPQGMHLQVPKKALVKKSDRYVVFTEEAGLAKWNYVIPGLDNGQTVVIAEGLTSGSRVIISNNLRLAHDSPVSVFTTNDTN
jgi:RND family efflux transporter MFP subunit